MPFAGFDDFDSCVRTMTDEEGHEQDAAERICGALQEEAKAENGNVDELMAALERGRGLIADVGVELNSAVDRPAIDSKWTMFKSVDKDGHDTQIDAPIVLKQEGDTEKRIAYAPAMIPRAVDKEGDVVSTPTVEQAAHDYLKQDGGVDSDHDLIDGKGEPVESWIEPEKRTWDLPDGSTETYPAGTWMVGIEWDADTWERIQSGELEGLSIYGKADHIPLEKSADAEKAFEVPLADRGAVHVLYESRSIAARAARELGFEGDDDEVTHEHEFMGLETFMPAPSHEEYVDAYMDEADDDETVEQSAEDADTGGTDGTTPKNADGATSSQDSPMSDTDIEDRVNTIESSVSNIEETVGTIKDAVDTDKQPGDGDAGDVLRDLAAELANRDEVAANTDEIMTELKSSFLSEKEDHDDDEEEHEEDYDDKGEGESDAAAETSKSDDGDAEPNYKGSDGSESAAVAKDAGGSTSGLPSYAATIEEDT